MSLLTWYKVLGQNFDGEGFYYFSKGHLDWRSLQLNFLGLVVAYDTLARLLAPVLMSSFGDRIYFYQFFMLMTMVIVNLLFYFLVYKLTHKRVLALTAFIFFGINTVGSFEMFATGNYQYFLQRIPNLIFVLIALILFVDFLKKGNRRSYFWAFFLWTLSLFLAQYSLFFLPMFIFYPLAVWLSKNKPRFTSGLVYYLRTILPFILVAFLFFWLDQKFFYSRPHWWLDQKDSFFTFAFRPQQWWGSFIYQLTWLNLPKKAIFLLVKPEALFLVPLYAIGLFYVWRRAKKLRSVFLASFGFVLSVLFLNVYTTTYQIKQIDWSNRYLYLPSMGWAILLAIFLYLLFYKKGLIGKLIFTFLLFAWVGSNLSSIWSRIDQEQWHHQATNLTFKYLKKNFEQFPDNALVILPEVFEYDAGPFCDKLYNKKKPRFLPISSQWQDEINENFDLERLVVLGYNIKTHEVINRSEEFRNKWER